MRTSYDKRELGQGFGDARLVLGFDEICDYFAGGLGQTIPEVCNEKSRTKAFYRFLEHKNVHPEKMIRAHRTEFEAQFSDGPKRRLLQISDSTELDFTGKKGAAQLGSLNYVHQRGMLLHNSLLFSDGGLPLGLLWQSYTVRSDEGFGRSRERLGLPIEQKETYRWVEHFEQGQALCREHPGLEVVHVADSEADITELFQCRKEERMHLLVRSKHDRLLADGSSRLYAQVQAQPCAGTYCLQLTDPRAQQERTATLEVRFGPVELTQQRKVRSKPDRSVVRLFAVEAREVDRLGGHRRAGPLGTAHQPARGVPRRCPAGHRLLRPALAHRALPLPAQGGRGRSGEAPAGNPAPFAERRHRLQHRRPQGAQNPLLGGKITAKRHLPGWRDTIGARGALYLCPQEGAEFGCL